MAVVRPVGLVVRRARNSAFRRRACAINDCVIATKGCVSFSFEPDLPFGSAKYLIGILGIDLGPGYRTSLAIVGSFGLLHRTYTIPVVGSVSRIEGRARTLGPLHRRGVARCLRAELEVVVDVSRRLVAFRSLRLVQTVLAKREAGQLELTCSVILVRARAAAGGVRNTVRNLRSLVHIVSILELLQLPLRACDRILRSACVALVVPGVDLVPAELGRDVFDPMKTVGVLCGLRVPSHRAIRNRDRIDRRIDEVAVRRLVLLQSVGTIQQAFNLELANSRVLIIEFLVIPPVGCVNMRP